MNDEAKKAAAREAIKYVNNHMVIGVGTGSTVEPFIDALNDRVENEGLQLKAVATSERSKKALHKNISLLGEELKEEIDLCVDGADRASKDFYLIKGGGGALLREKFVALNAKMNITIVDESKIATPLSDFPLPVEITPFGFEATVRRLHTTGFSGYLRVADDRLYTTDNGGYIFDIDLKEPIMEPDIVHNLLKSIHGVVETGLFLQTTDIIIIGKNDLSVDVWKKG